MKLPVPEIASALTCFGVKDTDTRLYYLYREPIGDSLYSIELAWKGSWVATKLNFNELRASEDSTAMTCFGRGGTDTRLYYFGISNNVVELSWDGRFWQTLVSDVSAPRAVPGSAITCFGVGGTDTRLYYLAVGSHDVVEVAFESQPAGLPGLWTWTNLSTVGAPPAARGSALTCFGRDGTDTRLYYLDYRNHLTELAWVGRWVHNDLDVTGALPRPGSALTCFGRIDSNTGRPSDTRLYYLDEETGGVAELAWSPTGFPEFEANPIGANAGAPPPALGSALTCFGVGGTDPRVYYLSGENIIELAWQGRWVANNLGIHGGHATPASALTCFGARDVDTRLYCVDPNFHLIELAFDGANWGTTQLT